MKCPQCGVAAAPEAAECAGCGVIFAKLKEVREREKAAAALLDKTLAADVERLPYVHPWFGRVLAIVATVAWILGFGLYYRHAVNEARERTVESLPGERRTIMIEDPATGELKAVQAVVVPPKSAETKPASEAR